MVRYLIAGTAVALALSTSALCAATLHVDDFQSGDQGWEGGLNPSVVSSGGPDGEGDAFLRADSNDGFRGFWAVFNVEDRWKGDYGSLGATAVTVDLMNSAGSDEVDMRLVLFGPDDSNDRWLSTTAQSLPADGVWRSYEFSLAEADLTPVLLVSPGETTYDDMIVNVGRIMFRHNPTLDAGGSVVNAVVGLDNIRLVGEAPGLTADFDDNGFVDGADLVIWEMSFGVDDKADANGDGVSDGVDFLTWQREFGDGVPPTAGAAVPEPTTLGLIYCGTTFCCLAALRRRSQRLA